MPMAADRALASVIARYAIPRAVPQALLEGFAWDREGRRYETLADLTAYAARVAGTVGAMMALLMDERRPEVLARACDLGVAMQFSNIARDVGEDARAGRLYLPQEWLREAGLDPEAWLAAPVFDAASPAWCGGCWPGRRRCTTARRLGSPGCRCPAARGSAPRAGSMPRSAMRWRGRVSTASRAAP